jgi:nicotinamidase-related amidase
MKKILIVVDYQNDFVDGSLGFPGAELLDESISRKICEYRDQGYPVVFTLDTHEDDYMSTQEGKNLPVSHCLRGSNGHAVFGKTGVLSRGGTFFEKNTFGSKALFEFLSDSDFQSVELVGLVSNICVLANAVLAKTAVPEAEIIVDASCTKSFDPDLHEKTLDVLRGLQITVTNQS